MTSPLSQQRILAIGAHLDDIELACGGTIAQALSKGHAVKMVVMSDSSFTGADGCMERAQDVAINEGKLAAEKLGVNDLEILDFPTKDVPYDSKTVSALDRIIAEFDPTLVLTHWPFDTHQAHRNTALSAISASRRLNSILNYEPFPPSGRSYVGFRPQVYIDITDFIDIKIMSMKAHKSQYDKYGEDWVEAIYGRARMRGYECGKKYAEVFEVVRIELSFS